MDFKKLDKAAKLHERIKQLDKEIIDIERLALMVATKKTELKFSLKVNDLEKTEVPKKTTCSDELVISFQGMFGGLYSPPTKKKDVKKYDHKFSEIVSDTLALQLLGVVIEDKKHIRELALKQIKKLGVTI
jgi:hypothetical protein